VSTFDIHFQLRAATDQRDALFTFFYASARGVRGFQKTVNQWVKCLLTRRGSDVTAKSYGTALPDIIGSNISSAEELNEFLVIAVQEATEQLRRAQFLDAANTPDEERLASAAVTSFEVSETGYVAYIELKSVLNQNVVFALPT